jgi:hypothetical protein
MSEDLLIKKLLLEVFGEQLAHMLFEWERLISNKDEFITGLPKPSKPLGMSWRRSNEHPHLLLARERSRSR